MSNHTRGPRKGRVPPHIQERVERKREKRAERIALGPWYRRRWFLIPAVAAVALVAGIVLGRVTAPDPVGAAADEADEVMGILDRSEAIWRAGTPQGGLPVSNAVDELRANGTTETIVRSLDGWLTAYDQVIGQLETAGVPPAADGVRRLALASAQLSKDATETLGAAAAADGAARDLLLDEVERIRARAEQHHASARRLLALLRGGELPDVDPAGTLPDLPRPTAPAAETAPADSPPAEEPSPAESPADEAPAAEPSPGTS